ncbi:MAG: acetyl-CoA C-acetyltransferase, partial [Gammaproteobacteria bacterium]|nr:acetyl-CoA C-acetyltransferase [Gammaproteobacteria bacterium]
MSLDSVVIVAARRTPIGGFQGVLSPLSATDLCAAAIKAAVADSGVDIDTVNELMMGCVLPAGVGQAPARIASLAAGLPKGVAASTLNKACGSGMKTTMLGHDLIRAGSAKVVISGGMESMTNAPYLLPKARGGMRMGHGEVLDHMFYDGLQNPADGNMMGSFAEDTAEKYGFSREAQDAFAIESVTRARSAAESGAFEAEITPVTVSTRKGDITVSEDEGPQTAKPEKIPTLRAAFRKDGTV